jgi:DNA-binding NtrC family response regulator
VSQIKVLIADDETDFLDSLSRVLTRRGFIMTKAEDGQKALDILAKERFDVIVLDLRMPVMDGIAALKEIRKTDKVTPILLLSGHVDVGYVNEALKGGAADYILKPCPVETLVSAIETACERATIARELQEKTKS